MLNMVTRASCPPANTVTPPAGFWCPPCCEHGHMIVRDVTQPLKATLAVTETYRSFRSNNLKLVGKTHHTVWVEPLHSRAAPEAGSAEDARPFCVLPPICCLSLGKSFLICKMMMMQ